VRQRQQTMEGFPIAPHTPFGRKLICNVYFRLGHEDFGQWRQVSRSISLPGIIISTRPEGETDSSFRPRRAKKPVRSRGHCRRTSRAE
jgi:hypothetical protein